MVDGGWYVVNPSTIYHPRNVRPKIFMKYLKVLYIQVLIGIALGVLTGWLFPGFASVAKSIADTFITTALALPGICIGILSPYPIASAADAKSWPE